MVAGARLTRVHERQSTLMEEIAAYDRHIDKMERTEAAMHGGGTVDYSIAIESWRAQRDEAVRELMILEERLTELVSQWQLALPGVA